MHRTEGEDFVLEAGKRRYTPAIPPIQPATRYPAEAANAIQEEICNVIENAGLALSETASIDRTSGWQQLYEAIFKAKHGTDTMLENNGVDGSVIKDNSIESDKLISIALEKAIGILTLPWTSGNSSGFTRMSAQQFRAFFTSPTTQENSILNSGGLDVSINISGTSNSTRVYANGLQFAAPTGVTPIIQYVKIPLNTSMLNPPSNSVLYVNTNIKKLGSRPIFATLSLRSGDALPDYSQSTLVFPTHGASPFKGAYKEIRFDSLDSSETIHAAILFNSNELDGANIDNMELNVWYAIN